jgi:hypothetical protein
MSDVSDVLLNVAIVMIIIYVKKIEEVPVICSKKWCALMLVISKYYR